MQSAYRSVQLYSIIYLVRVKVSVFPKDESQRVLSAIEEIAFNPQCTCKDFYLSTFITLNLFSVEIDLYCVVDSKTVLSASKSLTTWTNFHKIPYTDIASIQQHWHCIDTTTLILHPYKNTDIASIQEHWYCIHTRTLILHPYNNTDIVSIQQHWYCIHTRTMIFFPYKQSIQPVCMPLLSLPGLARWLCPVPQWSGLICWSIWH